jgi:hypothetical protein
MYACIQQKLVLNGQFQPKAPILSIINPLECPRFENSLVSIGYRIDRIDNKDHTLSRKNDCYLSQFTRFYYQALFYKMSAINKINK